MASYDFKAPRLFINGALRRDQPVALEEAQRHYLMHVMRLKSGAALFAFNGKDGEWRCDLESPGRNRAVLVPRLQSRQQPEPGDLHYLFAPLKRARLDYMVQKAVEMGVSRLQPVITRHTQAERVNAERMRANAIEAAEQCGILAVPEIGEVLPLGRAVEAIALSRLIVFCDEEAEVADPVAALAALRAGGTASVAVVIGPEGGFAEEERALLRRRAPVVQLSLGPRILRADTAAVAALALVQAVLGDWR